MISLADTTALLLVSIFTLSISASAESSTDPTGHLQPLGSHRPPEAVIASVTVDKIPSPEDFFNNYVLPGKPLLFEGAAKEMPAYSLWTDDYLSSKFGSLQMDVEEGKKENRSLATFSFKLKEFINNYKSGDIYMVESLPKPMREEYMLLKSLSCGGYLQSLQDAIMWFSSGGTKSVLHFDAVDNINCLFSGRKELFMIDKKLKHLAHIDKMNGAFSSVDVDKVDMYKYPGLQNVPWFDVKMTEGDCLFIPYRWIHQVRSFGPRNLAVNIWWAHFQNFNATDCKTSQFKEKDFVPLSALTFNPSEPTRQEVLMRMDGKPVNLEQWLAIFKKQADEFEVDFPENEVTKSFEEIDKSKDGLVSLDEVYEVKAHDIERLLNIPGPTEDDEEEEEEKPLGGSPDQGETPAEVETPTAPSKPAEHSEL